MMDAEAERFGKAMRLDNFDGRGTLEERLPNWTWLEIKTIVRQDDDRTFRADHEPKQKQWNEDEGKEVEIKMSAVLCRERRDQKCRRDEQK